MAGHGAGPPRALSCGCQRALGRAANASWGAPTGFGQGCKRAFGGGCQRALSYGGQRRTGFVARPDGHFNGGFRGTQQRVPCAAPRPLPLRYRSAPRPRGAPWEGLRGGCSQPGISNKKPDLVTNYATRSDPQINPVERLSKSGAIDIQRMVSRTSRSYYKGRSPCTWCNTDHPVSGLCEHGRSCCI